MTKHLYRVEPGRYFVVDVCRGTGSVYGSGETFKYRGIDASQHGFGCIISKYVEKGSVVVIQVGTQRLSFDVMWCESHLGIENMYRVGLTSVDPNVNVEETLNQQGFLELSEKQAS